MADGLSGGEQLPLAMGRGMMARPKLRMNVRVRLYYARGRGDLTRDIEVTLPETSTVQDLLVAVELPPQGDRICLVNGGHSHPATRLADGDCIEILPILDGG